MDCKKGSFTKFSDLPPELRCHVWGEFMGGHGLYVVECSCVLVDRTDDQDGSRTLRVALRPARPHLQGSRQRERLLTQKILLATCVESRAELYRRFPDTLGVGGLRFSFRHDLIYIVSDFLCLAFAGLRLPPKVRLEFEGGWNRLIHWVALNSEFFQIWSVLMRGSGEGVQMDWHSARLDRVMTFLTTCTSLRQLVLTRLKAIGFDGWAKLARADRTTLTERMTDCYAGLTCHASERSLQVEAVNFDEAALFLRQIILDDQQSAIHRSWVGKVKTGYPVLRHLEIRKMVHVSHELRWLCKDI